MGASNTGGRVGLVFATVAIGVVSFLMGAVVYEGEGIRGITYFGE